MGTLGGEVNVTLKCLGLRDLWVYRVIADTGQKIKEYVPGQVLETTSSRPR
jgi:hypothetical protein